MWSVCDGAPCLTCSPCDSRRVTTYIIISWPTKANHVSRRRLRAALVSSAWLVGWVRYIKWFRHPGRACCQFKKGMVVLSTPFSFHYFVPTMCVRVSVSKLQFPKPNSSPAWPRSNTKLVTAINVFDFAYLGSISEVLTTLKLKGYPCK